MTKKTEQNPVQFDELTKHIRSKIEPQRHALESQKTDIDQKIKALPDPVSDEVIMYARAANLNLDDVIWRIKAGLTPKQAVEVASNQLFENRLEDFKESVKRKTDGEIEEIAAAAGVIVPTGEGMGRGKLLREILKKQQ